MTEVTVADIATAESTATPSIQAVDLWLASAVPTSITIETILATIRILKVKSSKASQNNWKNPGGYLISF